MRPAHELVTSLFHARRSSPDDLRQAGLTVAVHNDYRYGGKPHTFWLMTFVEGDKTIALKGEGLTDEEALNQIRGQLARIRDKLHHAPCCPANHYHGQRAPTGDCTCGAAKYETEATHAD